MVVLTGPSGAGKSTLARGLESRGWSRLDGDRLAKSLYVPGGRLLAAVRRTFGAGCLHPDGTLDAAALGAKVFSSPAERRRLEAIVRAPFLRAFREALARARVAGTPWVGEMAVYFAYGAPRLGVPVVLVTAPLAVRLARLRALGLSAQEARRRANALRFGPTQRRAANLVLDGTLEPDALLDAFQRNLALLRPSPRP